jgi:hypothetical protein
VGSKTPDSLTPVLPGKEAEQLPAIITSVRQVSGPDSLDRPNQQQLTQILHGRLGESRNLLVFARLPRSHRDCDAALTHRIPSCSADAGFQTRISCANLCQFRPVVVSHTLGNALKKMIPDQARDRHRYRVGVGCRERQTYVLQGQRHPETVLGNSAIGDDGTVGMIDRS